LILKPVLEAAARHQVSRPVSSSQHTTHTLRVVGHCIALLFAGPLHWLAAMDADATLPGALAFIDAQVAAAGYVVDGTPYAEPDAAAGASVQLDTTLGLLVRVAQELPHARAALRLLVVAAPQRDELRGGAAGGSGSATDGPQPTSAAGGAGAGAASAALTSERGADAMDRASSLHPGIAACLRQLRHARVKRLAEELVFALCDEDGTWRPRVMAACRCCLPCVRAAVPYVVD
jgi:hypothetical protein